MGFIAALLLGLLVLSTRFDVSSPSLIDDWLFAGTNGRSFGGLLDLFADPIGARFRPGWELWNELSWHTVGAQGDPTAPTIWGAVRVGIFVAGVVLVPLLIAATSDPRPGPVAIGALGAAAGVLVFSGPWTDVDFFRLGPTEPLMAGALSCGTALLVLATRRAIEHPPWRPPRKPRRVVALGGIVAAGVLLWMLGTYQKEASITVLLLAPFLYLFLDRRWRDAGVIEGPLWRQRPFQVAAALMLLPMVHVALVTLTISDDGASLYGADRPTGLTGWIGRAFDALSFQWNGMSDTVGTPAWRGFAVLLLVLLASTVVWRRRVPWLPLGLIATGWAILVVQGLPLNGEPRYYIPSMALFAGAAVLLLAQAPKAVLWLGVASAAALAVANAGETRATLLSWADREADEAAAMREIAALHPGSCPVYMTNLDLERSEALPTVVRFVGEDLEGPCNESGGTILAGLRPQVPPEALGTTESMSRVCLESRVLAETEAWEIRECSRLRDEVDGLPVERIIEQNRVVPGVRLSRVQGCGEPGGARCP